MKNTFFIIRGEIQNAIYKYEPSNPARGKLKPSDLAVFLLHTGK